MWSNENLPGSTKYVGPVSWWASLFNIFPASGPPFLLARAIFTLCSIWSNVLKPARMCQVETIPIVSHYQIFKYFILWMQAYLSSEEFRQKFEMTKSDFNKLPKWKQDKLKMALELFWFSHVHLVPLQIPPTGMQPLEQECSQICMLSLSLSVDRSSWSSNYFTVLLVLLLFLQVGS